MIDPLSSTFRTVGLEDIWLLHIRSLILNESRCVLENMKYVIAERGNTSKMHKIPNNCMPGNHVEMSQMIHKYHAILHRSREKISCFL